jgi:hypothetical protein
MTNSNNQPQAQFTTTSTATHNAACGASTQKNRRRAEPIEEIPLQSEESEIV